MFIDAQTTEEWRARDFFSVLGPRAGQGAAPAADPLLLRMLALGRAHPFAEGQRLPAEVALDIDRTLTCPASSEFEDYAREHPLGGMPYGMAPLRDEEIRILASWVAQGTPAPPAAALPAPAQGEVAKWEALPERRLAQGAHHQPLSLRALVPGPSATSRASRPARSSRSCARARRRASRSTRSPRCAPTTIRASRALVPAAADRVDDRAQDAHRVPARATRSSRACASCSSTATGSRRSSRPTRRRWRRTRSSPSLQMPARSRYQYLLDDAQYFVMTFIRGPVCRGQVAVDVIEDQFWVAFLDPDRDLSVIDSRLPRARRRSCSTCRRSTGAISVPASCGSSTPASSASTWTRARASTTRSIPQHRGPALDWIWDGDGTNPNALLTVFRNFDNATVVKGFVGEIPKTAWVMDYPIFERIYYDLVAGFDVFGNVVAPGGDAALHGPPAHAVGEPLPRLPARGPARGDPRLVVRRRHAHRSTTSSPIACARSITARRSSSRRRT